MSGGEFLCNASSTVKHPLSANPVDEAELRGPGKSTVAVRLAVCCLMTAQCPVFILVRDAQDADQMCRKLKQLGADVLRVEAAAGANASVTRSQDAALQFGGHSSPTLRVSKKRIF
jgi:hypothetical protein